MENLHQQPSGMNSGRQQQGEDFNERQQSAGNMGNTIKDPEEWTTGNERMTGAQRSYLNTLAAEAGEKIDENMTKAEASKKIEELQQKTGRGTGNNGL